MKWKMDQVAMYTNAKEYVDTAILPLTPIQWGKDEKNIVNMGEYTNYLSDYIEKQFTGRVFLFPSFTYLKQESKEEKVRRLLEWDKHLYQEGFKYIMYITADSEWKIIEKKLPGELIWLPAISTESTKSDQFKKTIQEQVEQVMPLFSLKWQEEPDERED